MDAVLERIGEIGVVPVVKIESASKAAGLGRALLAGGIPVAEVTFRTEAAEDAIRAMVAEVPGLLVGAGSVRSVEQAKAAIGAGASFVVSPGFNDKVVKFCLERKVSVLPGISGTEGIEKGLDLGLSVLKFFPAEASGGIPMLEALAGPYANLSFVPTGGVNAANLGAYLRLPQVLAVGGSWMVKPELVEAEDWAGVEALCRAASLAVQGFSFAHLGVNGSDEAEARRGLALLSRLFGIEAREGASSFMAEGLEVTKGPFPGAKGHIAIRCNSVERALARLRGLGVGPLPETEKLEKGRIKAVYLDAELLGFAIHLLRA